MQFEEFNNKIKEAAEQHHPAYDEKAWQKMEKLLDKHLPQEEKDRRRIIFIILFFLLVGGGLFIGINKPWQKNNAVQNESTVATPKNNSQQENTQPAGNSQVKTEDIRPNNENRIEQPSLNNNNNNDPQHNLVVFDVKSRQKNIKNEPLIVARNNSPVVEKDKTGNDVEKNKTGNDINTNDEIKKIEATPTNTNVVKTDNSVLPVTDNVQNNVVAPKNNDAKQPVIEENKTAKNNAVSKNKKNNSGSNKFLSGLGFSLSAGPDVSKAGNSQMGKTTFAFGAGISYSLKKFTLRSGLYSAKKIYYAGEDDYKLGYPLLPNVKFEGADANCRVLEIPFTLTYNFAQGKSGNWFGGAGLSSYLMSREDYTYWYTNYSTGSYYPKYYEVKNKNKHYFSVLDFSVGYTRQLSKSISITAEPYLKIPFTGIGQGNVHLNSGGVLFSLGIKPFNNKKKN